MNRTLKHLADRFIFWVGIVVSIHLLSVFIYAAYSDNGVPEKTVGISLSAIVLWTLYLMHRFFSIGQLYSPHITAFFILLGDTFFVIYNPMDYQEVWIILLFYPIMISLFQNRQLFTIWGIFAFLLAGLFIIVDFSQMGPGDSMYALLISRLFLYAGSLLLGWIIMTYSASLKKSFLQKGEEQNKEYLIRLLQTLIPIVERKSRISSKEIVLSTGLMKRMMSYFPNDRVEYWEIQLLSLLHFISRIEWPDYVFDKPDKLTLYEYQLVKEHCYIGRSLLGSDSSLKRVREALQAHHERYDGTGYPCQLKGEEIPRLAQILGVVECFIAMTSPRAYREAFSFDKAMSEIESMAGTAFDPKVVESLRDALELYDKSQTRTKASPLVG
ncbi:HD-GYP domain-containing protein [Brevibacillus sp. B_LB10_24]|uniref:HD-GYP domain-containing protein n=1 Tax=Brevibacillus sp. B_LB10_24 TaxID=3380645 RepID=UPI0038B6BB73